MFAAKAAGSAAATKGTMKFSRSRFLSARNINYFLVGVAVPPRERPIVCFDSFGARRAVMTESAEIIED